MGQKISELLKCNVYKSDRPRNVFSILHEHFSAIYIVICSSKRNKNKKIKLNKISIGSLPPLCLEKKKKIYCKFVVSCP